VRFRNVTVVSAPGASQAGQPCAAAGVAIPHLRTTDCCRLARNQNLPCLDTASQAGPQWLVQGYYGILVRQAVFIHNVSASETFGRPDPVSAACGGPCAYNATDRTAFWGMVRVCLARVCGWRLRVTRAQGLCCGRPSATSCFEQSGRDAAGSRHTANERASPC
jgi:hypothetical protein